VAPKSVVVLPSTLMLTSTGFDAVAGPAKRSPATTRAETASLPITRSSFREGFGYVEETRQVF